MRIGTEAVTAYKVLLLLHELTFTECDGTYKMNVYIQSMFVLLAYTI